jgi:hypothetical protein
MRLGHHCGSTLVTAYGDRYRCIVKSIQHREIAFSRNAEHVFHPLKNKFPHQNLPTR